MAQILSEQSSNPKVKGKSMLFLVFLMMFFKLSITTLA